MEETLNYAFELYGETIKDTSRLQILEGNIKNMYSYVKNIIKNIPNHGQLHFIPTSLNLKYIANGNQSKEDLLKDTSLSEFAYLYKIIYSTPLKQNMRKIDAFRTIEKYFNGISRAVSIKP